MEREYYGIFWVKPPELTNNELLLVANAIDGVGTKSSPRPEENTTLKPEFKTEYDDKGNITVIASRWIKAGVVSDVEKEVEHYYKVGSDVLDMSLATMPGVIGYMQTDKQGAKDEMP